MEWPLSQEVSDIVVDLAVEDAYSLDNFALMSRSMLHRTRHHRFHRVAISISPSSDSCEKLYGILLSSERIRPYIKSFFLKGPSSHLELPNAFGTQASPGETSWGATRYTSLVSLTELLLALEELHIEHFSLSHLPYEFLLQLKKFTRVNKITLHNIAFPSYSTFASIVRAFPSLEILRLKLVSGAVDSDARIEVQTGLAVPTIKTLDIDLSGELVLRMCGDICEGKDAPASVAQLHTLRIGSIKDISHWNRARSVVQMSANTLRNLQLGYIQTESGHSELIASDVSGLGILPLHSLKHLHIHLNDFEDAKDVDVLRWWIRCFKDATASFSLEHNEYDGSEKGDAKVFQDDVWCELDACLPLSTDEVVVIFTGANPLRADDPEDPFKKRVDRLKEIIGGRMNRFKKRSGVLVFEEPV
ncbi:hypothetical protein IW262DRAFT_1518937 [Armillaria fumosa]|nr:hypothetical protein IW262DRAFT_1518937 [Armillaria fumosa]